MLPRQRGLAAGRLLLRLLGMLVGLAIAGAAIASVFLIDWRRPLEAPEPVIRPVVTVRVGAPEVEVRTIPARVRAATEATLSFQVPGVVEALPIFRSKPVNRGDLLAQLDRRDFQSRLAAAQVQFTQLSSELAAVLRAYELGAATTMEVARFRAAADRASAERDVAEKALEDATLLAPFDGVIADVFVDQFQKVTPGLPVLRLQGRSPVQVEINVDAARVAFGTKLSEATTQTVRFDFLPEREYDATLVEFTTEADRTTQTFLAIFEIVGPDDALILPGMTATVIERTAVAGLLRPGAVSVPVESVAVDGTGNHFVWTLVPEPGGLAAVHRTPVSVGEATESSLLVTGGLAPGATIVAAGVHQLVEGQRVRPLPRDAAAAR